MIRQLQILAVMTLALLAGSCATQTHWHTNSVPRKKPAGAHLNESEAIKSAKATAERFGVDLNQCPEPTATFVRSCFDIVWPLMADAQGKRGFGDAIWAVHFGWGPNTNYPGGDFTVYVDAKTGRSRLVGGM